MKPVRVRRKTKIHSINALPSPARISVLRAGASGRTIASGGIRNAFPRLRVPHRLYVPRMVRAVRQHVLRCQLIAVCRNRDAVGSYPSLLKTVNVLTTHPRHATWNVRNRHRAKRVHVGFVHVLRARVCIPGLRGQRAKTSTKMTQTQCESSW